MRSWVVEHNLVGRVQDGAPFCIEGSQSKQRMFWRLGRVFVEHRATPPTQGQTEMTSVQLGRRARWWKLPRARRPHAPVFGRQISGRFDCGRELFAAPAYSVHVLCDFLRSFCSSIFYCPETRYFGSLCLTLSTGKVRRWSGLGNNMNESDCGCNSAFFVSSYLTSCLKSSLPARRLSREDTSLDPLFLCLVSPL